jgi:hypothetical protein
MNFGEQIIHYYKNLKLPIKKLPNQIEWIENLFQPETQETLAIFYKKYFSDNNKRVLLLGINPGRFGAGVTGVPFTDPINLEEVCGIKNDFEKRFELSSKFIYDVVDAFGGAEEFFNRVYISSISPVGFIKNNKNINYYDDKELQEKLWEWMKLQIEKQLRFGIIREVAYSIGSGKNLKVLQQMNEEEKWFKKIDSVPHPRWVMQYRLKRKQEFIDEYLQKITSVKS